MPFYGVTIIMKVGICLESVGCENGQHLKKREGNLTNFTNFFEKETNSLDLRFFLSNALIQQVILPNWVKYGH